MDVRETHNYEVMWRKAGDKHWQYVNMGRGETASCSSLEQANTTVSRLSKAGDGKEWTIFHNHSVVITYAEHIKPAEDDF